MQPAAEQKVEPVAENGVHVAEKGEGVSPPVHKEDPEGQRQLEDTKDDPFLVAFGENDPENPRTWSNPRRYYIAWQATYLNFLCTWVASGYSTGSMGIGEQFMISDEVVTLGLALFVLGFAVGPLFVAPISEFFGRRPTYLVSWGVFFALQPGVIWAPNTGALLVFRFLTGTAGSAPLANTGGVVHDLFSKTEDGLAMGIYALSSASGPSLGNVLSGYITQNKGWRWGLIVPWIVCGVTWFQLLLTMPETRHNVLLRKRAEKIRAEKNDDRYYALLESEHNQPGRLFKVVLLRPWKFLFTEPITAGAALFNGFVFGLIFLFNEAFPLVFGPPEGGIDSYNWSHPGTVDLTFLAICIGVLIAFIAGPFTQDAFFARSLARNNGQPIPEWRMWSSLYGCLLLPIGLFMFAWTAYPSVNFIAPLIATAIFGAGFYILILASLAYVVDCYETYSASSLAAVVCVRNLAGAGFPLFAAQMYKRLKQHWATSLLAFLSLILIPVVYTFYYRGAALRRKSPFAASHTTT